MDLRLRTRAGEHARLDTRLVVAPPDAPYLYQLLVPPLFLAVIPYLAVVATSHPRSGDDALGRDHLSRRSPTP